MKALRFLLLFTVFVSITASAKTNLEQFITPRDLTNSTFSKIELQNSGSSAKTIYGLYVRRYAYVTPGQSCSSPTVVYSLNVTAGAMVMPVVINGGKSAAIGANYLYNMIYGAIYYASVNALSPPCALPGCTWGSDSTTYDWCIYLGAFTPVSRAGSYTSNVPPTVAAASSSGNYDYNAISSYSSLGPISCDDQTLTCTDESRQTQSFS